MEKLTKITVKALNGDEITFEVDSYVSQWHSEQMSEVYTQYSQYYDKETKKMNIDAMQTLKLNRLRDSKLIETFVKGWSLEIPCSGENVKKTLHPTEYTKLIEAIEKIYSDLTEEKKSLSPEDSSPDSIHKEIPTAQ